MELAIQKKIVSKHTYFGEACQSSPKASANYDVLRKLTTLPNIQYHTATTYLSLH